MRNQRGISIVTVLLASAIAGMLVIAVLTLIDQVSKNVARSTAMDNIEAAVRTVQGIVTNRELCDNALRGAGGANAKLNFSANALGVTSPVEIVNLYAQSASGQSATQVLFRNQNIGSGYRVLRMEFRERSPYVGPPNVPPYNSSNGRGRILLNGVNYTTVAGQIMIRFGPAVAQTGVTALQDRLIPYNAVIHPGPDGVALTGDDYIDRCYQDSSAQYMCEQLGGTYDLNDGSCDSLLSTTDLPGADCQEYITNNDPGSDCTPVDPPGASCQKVYYIAGWNVGGSGGQPVTTPICRCQKVCIGSGGGGGATATATATATAAAASATGPTATAAATAAAAAAALGAGAATGGGTN